MKTPLTILYTCLLVVLASCSKEFASPKDSNIGVFDELCQFVEENYALFEIKPVDWAMVKARYRLKVSNLIARDSFLSICRETVAELKDGQSYVGRFAYSDPYDFTIGYDVQFKLDVTLGYMKRVNNYSIFTRVAAINDSIGYGHFSSFSDLDSDNYRDELNYLNSDRYKKIIIDLRNAYGGYPTEAFNFVSHFISTTTTVGSMVHKSGKGPKDFKKVPVVIQPTLPYLGNKKIIILTNRNTFHTSTYVTTILQDLPNVTLIGQNTGPGSGIELPYELPNGWIVAVASNYFLPANGHHIEDGIRPDIEINNTATDLQNKRDRMLERAIAY